MKFTLKVFSLVFIENERVVIFEYCDVTLFSHFSHFGAENRQLFARVCARSIAPSVVLSMICVSAELAFIDVGCVSGLVLRCKDLVFVFTCAVFFLLLTILVHGKGCSGDISDSINILTN